MTKGCYTCRRRRIICDNGQPTCRKCRDAGKECLGYQKPLVWVKGGVASRGKMMGRSFDDVMKPESVSKHQESAAPNSPTAPTDSFGFFSVAESSSDTSSPSSGVHTSPEADAWATEAPEVAPCAFVEEDNSVGLNLHEESDQMVVHVPRGTSAEYIPTPWGLADPVLKDLGQLSRFYIYHYNQSMTGDFVVYSESNNPWRNIISLVGGSPLLANVLSAMGALHFSLRSNSDSTQMPWSSNLLSDGSNLSSEEIESFVTPAGARRPSSKAFQHFLEFKQRTLHQLSKDLSNPVMQKDDRTLAAIVVLALLDLIESGSGAWSYHIEGAKKLLRDRPENELGQGILQGLESFAVDGCLIMEIMGSTLARPGALSKPFYSAAMGPAMLKRLEQTSWVGCPAYLLEVIFFIHTLWYPDSEFAAAAPQPTSLPVSMQPGQPLSLESYFALLQGIRDFDPVAWAHEMQAFYFLPDVSSRASLARAYQAAVYLYTSRVLSRAREGYSPPFANVALPSDHSAVAHDLLTQICSVPHSDPHFKCLIWPTFIAGAECRRSSQRGLILETLGALYQAVTSVNVQNAAWVLRLMWQKRDQKRDARTEHLPSGYSDSQTDAGSDTFGVGPCEDDDYDDTFDWVDQLDESRLDWLFI
ncbi:hypothetical protein N7462_002240 [Penicillium macrosclerotiorum]|uniref:uncharacterized protein n=1 Tax=Penicillium macrosclerotiorum TaxID=303699 RepID=UPI0025475F55|nr:uncharacterized protein N7462_002240 [Penicillium macrosclerotiorum]KAJ5692817.1 hypothetical protein N7462_002240 [Penicillium macrosclerotiorum]